LLSLFFTFFFIEFFKEFNKCQQSKPTILLVIGWLPYQQSKKDKPTISKRQSKLHIAHGSYITYFYVKWINSPFLPSLVIGDWKHFFPQGDFEV